MTSRVRASILALTFAVLITVPAVAAAQEKATFGVKAGVNIATAKTDDDDDIESKVGAVAGIFLGKSLTKSVGIRAEGLFSQKGAKGEDAGVDLKFNLTYIDVPVLLVVGPESSGNTRFNFFTGPQFSFNTKAEAVGSSGGVTIKEDLDEEIKGSDLAWVAGVGLENGRWSADARYSFGLKNISTDSGSIKNRVFAVMVGVKLSK